MHGGAETLLEAHRALLERGADRVGPLAIPLSLANAPCAAAARGLGLRGPSRRAGHRLRRGLRRDRHRAVLLRDGRAEAMVAGGADAPISPLVVAGYIRVGALTRSDRPPERASRPFDRRATASSWARAPACCCWRSASTRWPAGRASTPRWPATAATCDANHLTDPDATGEGPARAMRLALADAGLGPGDIGYVNAHATSTLVRRPGRGARPDARGPGRGGRVLHQGRRTATPSAAPAGWRPWRS